MNRTSLIASSVVAALAGSALGQCQPEWLRGPTGTLPSYGTNGTIPYALTITSWAPPGSASPRMYIGGWFTSVGGSNLNYIASWDGTRWSGLGSGMDREVFDMVPFNGQLVVGGRFTTAGGTPAIYVARWTGSQWIGMGTFQITDPNNGIDCLAVYNSQLYAGGLFTINGTTGGLAQWNGTAWQFVPGLSGAFIDALEVYGGHLIVGGIFNFNGTTHGILQWDGSNWSDMGAGIANSIVETLKFRPADNSLYVGGTFTTAGGIATGGFARWDGAWHANGGAFGGTVHKLENNGNDLVIAGNFPGIGGSPNIAQYDGANYTNLGSGGANSDVFALGAYNDAFYVGGPFTSIGGQTVQHLAQWSGATWSPVLPGPNAPVRAILPSGAGFYAAGDFQFAIDPATTANRIISTDGATAGAVTNIAGGGGPPNGTTGPIRALGAYRTGTIIFPRTSLIVGGTFAQAGGLNAANIASFDINGWAPMGSGTDGAVNAILQYRISNSNNHMIAAGEFTTAGDVACNHIAQWNGAWTPLGSGLAGLSGNALALYNGQLYAGGTFVSAGGVPASDIARWDGATWNALDGTGFIDGINALTVYNGQLVAAGPFQTLSGPALHYAAAWTGSSWTAMDAGLPNLGSGFIPHALAVHQGELYLGGAFVIVESGGPPEGLLNSTVYHWSGGSWNPIGGVLSGDVYALASVNGDLWAGGSFTVGSGNATPYLARLPCAACYANCDNSASSPVLNVADFACFLNAYAAGNPYANCDGSTTAPVLTIADFACFLNKFAAGCP